MKKTIPSIFPIPMVGNVVFSYPPFLLDFVDKCLSYKKKILYSLFLLLPLVGMSQSLQWSQFTSPKPSSSTRTVAIEKVPNGPIYVLSSYQIGANSDVPMFSNTTDRVILGSSGRTPYQRNSSELSKYSADGKTLIWSRALTTSTPPLVGASAMEPLDLALTPSGEIIVLTVVNSAAPHMITPDAFQPNPPTFSVNATNTGVAGRSGLITYFDADGNITYGTYVGPKGGSLRMFPQAVTSVNTPEALKVAADGTLFFTFAVSRDALAVGKIATTANAYITEANHTFRDGAPNQGMLMVFNPDHTLKTSTYLNNGFEASVPREQAIAPNGDYYIAHGQKTMRFNSQGQFLSEIAMPSPLFPINTPDLALYANAIVVKPNGNILGATPQGDFVEFDAGLTSVVSNFNPFGASLSGQAFGGRVANNMALDAAGRLHVVFTNESGFPKPTTAGALQGSNSASTVAWYAIIDLTQQKIVYSTEIGALAAGQTSSGTNLLIDLLVEGCTTYIVGRSDPGAGFPVTPTAYNSDGTATVSGYNVSTTNTANNTSDGVLLAINYPVQKANTNVLTAPAVTNFCAGSGVLPIDGTKTEFLTPSVIGRIDANPAPVPTHYQWQRSTTATGPWIDLADSDQEDYAPIAPAVSGTYYFRRLVRQTPFGQDFAVPSCDETDISNVISLSFSSNKTHSTNIPKGKYGLCKGGTALALSYTITPSADGSFGPYTYKLTTTSNLVTTALSQSGTVASVSNPINLSVGVAGDYVLQVIDSRGCTSFDTLNVENLRIDAGAYNQFTCGTATIKIGPASLPPTYINYASNTFSWTPAAGLDNPLSVSPTFTHGLAVGASVTKYLTFNGCVVDSVLITNQSVTPLPILPDLAVCQGDTLRLGTSGPGTAPVLISQSGVTYEWAPGIGLTSNTVANPLVTICSARGK